MPPIYATADELRASLNVDTATLGDAKADELLELAEDAIDAVLAARPVDETTGRKVVEADVDPWRWAKLKRATLLAASRLYANPDAIDGDRYTSTSGPDFTFTGRVGAGGMADRLGPACMAVLNASGLRRTGTRAVPSAPIAGRSPGWPYDPDLDGDDSDAGA